MRGTTMAYARRTALAALFSLLLLVWLPIGAAAKPTTTITVGKSSQSVAKSTATVAETTAKETILQKAADGAVNRTVAGLQLDTEQWTPVIITVPGATVTTTVATVNTLTITRAVSEPTTIDYPPVSTYFQPASTEYITTPTTEYSLLTTVISTVVSLYAPIYTLFPSAPQPQNVEESSSTSVIEPTSFEVASVTVTVVDSTTEEEASIIADLATEEESPIIVGPTPEQETSIIFVDPITQQESSINMVEPTTWVVIPETEPTTQQQSSIIIVEPTTWVVIPEAEPTTQQQSSIIIVEPTTWVVITEAEPTTQQQSSIIIVEPTTWVVIPDADPTTDYDSSIVEPTTEIAPMDAETDEAWPETSAVTQPDTDASIVTLFPSSTSIERPTPTGDLFPPEAAAIPIPNVVGECAANCEISVNGECKESIQDAINAVLDGGTISLAEGAVLRGETETGKSFNLVGCGGGRANVRVDMNMTHGGVILASGNGQSIGLFNLAVEGSGARNYSSIVRTPDLGDENYLNSVTTGPVSLYIDNCEFRNFRTQARGGSVIFIGKVGDVSITNSEFRDNTCVVFQGRNRWDGGGAVWLLYHTGRGMVRDCVFVGNKHEFSHGVGAALMVLDMARGSRFDVVSTLFEDNKASGGGALYFRDIGQNAILNIDSRFVRNQCVWTEGYGCRGGVAWLQNIDGEVFLKGTYDGNEANGDRGAVIANNRMHPTARVVVSGAYTNNRCTKGAAVWDTLYGFERGAQLTILQETVFSGNIGKENRDVIVQLLSEADDTDPDKRDIVRTEENWRQSGQQWHFLAGTPNPNLELEYKSDGVKGVIFKVPAVA